MRNYNEVAELWILAHRKFVRIPTRRDHSDTIPVKYLPSLQGITLSQANTVDLISIWPSENEEMMVANQVHAKIEAKIEPGIKVRGPPT